MFIFVSFVMFLYSDDIFFYITVYQLSCLWIFIRHNALGCSCQGESNFYSILFEVHFYTCLFTSSNKHVGNHRYTNTITYFFFFQFPHTLLIVYMLVVRTPSSLVSGHSVLSYCFTDFASFHFLLLINDVSVLHGKCDAV